MEGVGGKPAWAWIFIIEGLITVVAGFMSFWIIQDFPDTAKFLTETERVFVIRRLQSDDQFSAAGEKLRWHYIFQSWLDWKTWVGSEYLSGLRIVPAADHEFSASVHGHRRSAVCILPVPAKYHQRSESSSHATRNVFLTKFAAR